MMPKNQNTNSIDVAVNKTITQRLSAFRKGSWEDDLSRNSLDNEPFENGQPIAERIDGLALGEDTDGTSYNLNELLGREEINAAARRDTFPIPPPEDREGYLKGYDGKFWLSGLSDYLKVMNAAKSHNISLNRVFDFGSASGRVVRHFAVQSDVSEIWASDINARHVRWMSNYLPKTVIPIANHSIPTLPIPDNHLDAVTAFSVFTHIDTFETCWLAELRRILRPGGLAYLTVHNEDTWDLLKTEVENEKNRLVQTMINSDPDTPAKLEQPLPQGRTVYRFTNVGPYRSQVFHSNSYLQNVWNRFFEILEIVPRHHNRQTVMIMRKPA